MNRLLLLIVLSATYVLAVAATNEVIVEKPTLVGRLKNHLNSLMSLVETKEEGEPSPVKAKFDDILNAPEKPGHDEALDEEGKPVFNGTKKVGFDKGELDPLFDEVENKTNATRVVAVTFHGRKHKKPRKTPTTIELNTPTLYNDRINYRKARKVMAEVISEYPDKHREVELSTHARCVDTDPYFPGWKNPTVFPNPTPMRKYARNVAVKIHENTAGNVMHEATTVITDTPVNTEENLKPVDHSTEEIISDGQTHHTLKSPKEEETIISLDKGIKEMAEIMKNNETLGAENNLKKLQQAEKDREAKEDAEEEEEAKDDENPKEAQ